MINLTKGESVSLQKGALMGVRISWPAATDYDAGCEILYKDGTTESIATFGARGVTAKTVSKNGTVRHTGDAVRGVGTAHESIDIQPDPEIEQIVPWAYSAQSNGSGSFWEYAVSVEVYCGDDHVRIDADHASNDRHVYTCVPAIIKFDNEKTSLLAVEYYSQPGSERRPTFRGEGWLNKSAKLTMDGPRNNYK